ESTRKHRYVSRELVQKDVGRSRKPDVPDALSGAGRHEQNFRTEVGVCWLAWLPKPQILETLMGYSGWRGAPGPCP
ncbi:hypothetical protein MTR67_034203, partial [Solanum verrucosum]